MLHVSQVGIFWTIIYSFETIFDAQTHRIAQAIALSTPALVSFDVFRQQKQEGFANSTPSMLSLASWLLATLRDVLAGDAKPEDIWNILLQVNDGLVRMIECNTGVPLGEQM